MKAVVFVIIAAAVILLAIVNAENDDWRGIPVSFNTAQDIFT